MPNDAYRTTLDKLRRLERRRRRLTLLRGGCAGIVSFLLFLLVVATIDWLMILPDATRWALSSVGYFTVIVMLWVTCVRRLVRAPGALALARHVENETPELRERLLPAIELNVEDMAPVHDSLTFRRYLQTQVGQQMATIDIRSVLPLRAVLRWLLAAAALMLVCALLVNLPNLPARQLLARALLPGANIDRVSRIQVTILEPIPHSTIAAQDEPLAVVITTSGGIVRQTQLETRTAAGEVAQQSMRHLGDGKFSSILEIGEAVVHYRIRAGDAVTRWYTIRPHARPRVLRFHKRYHFPEYAQVADRLVAEPTGDLVGLQGSTVYLKLDLNEPVSTAELHVRAFGADTMEVVPIRLTDNHHAEVELVLDTAGIYKVRLVGKDTGFENTFSPDYETRPQPDLIPRVGFVDQSDTTLLVPPHDILPLTALAEDDLPLVRLEQLFSVNGESWQRRDLEIESRMRVTCSWDWDLLDLSLASGDQVITKLVATDRKGNTGESVPLQLVIAAADFDPERHRAMQTKLALFDELRALATDLEQNAKRAAPLAADLAQPQLSDQVRAGRRAAVLDIVDKSRERINKTVETFTASIPKLNNQLDATEAVRAGWVLVNIQQATLPRAGAAIELADAAKNSEQTAVAVGEISTSLDECAKRTGTLADYFQVLVTPNVCASFAADLEAIRRHHRQLLDTPTRLGWRRLLRQETVAINQIRVLEQLVRSTSERLPAAAQNATLRLLDWTRARRDRLEAATESEDRLPALRQAVQEIAQSAQRELDALPINGNLTSQVTNAQSALVKETGTLFTPLHATATTMAQLVELRRKLESASDSATSRELRDSQHRLEITLRRVHPAQLGALPIVGGLVRAQAGSDTRFVADLTLTRRAVDNLLQQFTQGAKPADDAATGLGKVAPAYRVLEAGHAVVELRTQLTLLMTAERWDLFSLAGRFDNPRQWNAALVQLESAANKLKAAGIPREISTAFDRLKWSASTNAARQKIRAHAADRQRTVGIVHELEEIDLQLANQYAALQPLLDAARATIATYVPSIPDLARQAARQVRSLEQRTSDLARETQQIDRNLAAAQMDQLQAKQQAINAQLSQLSNALTETANRQDLMTPAGRAVARDADDSRAMVQNADHKLNAALQQAEQAPAGQPRTQQLDRAAETQLQAAQSLDMIAKHFDQLHQGDDIAATRDQLRQQEHALGLQRRLDQQYDAANQLGTTAQKTPQQRLAELEAELPENPPMQNALSDISKDILQQAKNALDYAAQQEGDTRRALERSDPDFHQAKDTVARQLQALGRKASDLSRTLVAQGNSAAARAQLKDVQQRMQQAQRRLTNAATQTTRVKNDQLLEDLSEIASELAKDLDDAAEQLHRSDQTAQQATQQPAGGDAKQQAQLKRDMEDLQRKLHDQIVREARDQVRQLEQQQKRTEREVATAENRLRNAERQVTQAAKRVQLRPDSTAVKRALDQTTEQWHAAEDAVRRAQQRQQLAKQQTEAMSQVSRELQKNRPQPLNAPNPAAELTQRSAHEAAAVASELADQAKQLAAKPAWANKLQPGAPQLTQAAAKQPPIQSDVTNVADDIARAGRHEQRLGNAELGERLNALSQSIQHVADTDVPKTAQMLTEAADTAAARRGAPAADSPPNATAAPNQVAQTQQAIAAQAAAIDQVLQTESAAPRTAPSAADAASQTASQSASQSASQGKQSRPADSAPSSQPSAAAASEGGRQLAQQLDELDQAIASASSTPADAAAQSAVGNLPSVAQAARNQAAQMAQQRAQSAPTPASASPPTQSAQQSGMGADVANMADPDAPLPTVDRSMTSQWGQLRDKAAEDVLESQDESVAAAYRRQVQTYFRVIAERARQRRQATQRKP